MYQICFRKVITILLKQFPYRRGKKGGLIILVERIMANIKQYCSNLRKRPNLLNYTLIPYLVWMI